MSIKRRALAAVAATVALAGCASTVQPTGQAQLGGAGVVPAATGGLSAPEPVGTGPGSTTGTTSGDTAAGAGGGSSTSVRPGGIPAPGHVKVGGAVPQQPTSINTKLPPVKLGYTITDLTGAKSAFGGGGNFDTSAQEQASVDAAKALIRYANQTGGVGGREIVGYQTTIDTADGLDENRRTARCVSATEDQHVDAMIGTDSFFSESDTGCFAAHHTPLLAILHSISQSFVSAHRPYLATTWGAPERTEAALVDGAARAGFFQHAVVGAVIDDEPTIRQIYQQIVVPRLASIGVKVVTAHYFAPLNPGTQASEGQSAALDFKSRGVNRVLVLCNVLSLIGFTNAEQTENYYPRLAIGDYQIAATAAAAAGNVQTFSSLGPAMKDALGVSVGRLLIRDKPSATAGADIPKDERVIGPGLKHCLDVLSSELHENYYNLAADHQARVLTSFCDEFFLWLDAARRVGASVTRQTWGAGLVAVQHTFEPADVHATFFDNAHFDGALDYHVGVYFAANPDCSCYKNLFPGRYFTLPG